MQGEYCTSGQNTGGIRNLVLIYNGYYDRQQGDWSAQELLPYLLYQKRNAGFGEPFFDGFLFLGLLSCTGNQLFEAVDPAKAATWEDFEWYLNKTLRPQGKESRTEYFILFCISGYSEELHRLAESDPHIILG